MCASTRGAGVEIRPFARLGANPGRNRGQRMAGSLTGVVASKSVTEASKGTLDSGDNRLIAPKSSYRRSGLAPRCRLVTSWGWRRFQGLGCSPIKVARELGSERRETVRSLSVAGVESGRGLTLVREDRVGRAAGVPVVPPGAWQGSQARNG